eukprot:scaffold14619_cov66-Phaeocystis_antarctica.AAC.8
MSRGLVQYPMRVGESERSGWRDYDDGSAGNAAKYDDARADDNNLGGNDDDDDRLCPTSRTTVLMASAVLK